MTCAVRYADTGSCCGYGPAGLADRGVGLRSLGEGIDTTTAAGRLLLHVLGAIAQFERDLIIDRTRAGLAAAKARGRIGGRPPAMTPEKLAAARALIAAGHTGEQAASAIGVSRATLCRHLGDRAAAAAVWTSSLPTGRGLPARPRLAYRRYQRPLV